MKTYFVGIAMSIFLWNTVFGEIKNGYGTDIRSAEQSMFVLTRLLRENSNMPKYKERKIKESIRSLTEHITYLRLTDQLLSQFKVIAPELYDEINSIKDKKNRPVDVHIKFVPLDATRLKSWGTTYISQSATDHDAYVSEYGENTVSVKIWTVSKALLVLAHELGHVKYQVPNLRTYLDYHRANYLAVTTESDRIGHEADDPSGAKASEYEKRYRETFSHFLKETKDKFETPLATLEHIIRAISKESADNDSFARLENSTKVDSDVQ
jgi:hypothetical protein